MQGHTFFLFGVHLDISDCIYTEHVDYQVELEFCDKLDNSLSLALMALIKIVAILQSSKHCEIGEY